VFGSTSRCSAHYTASHSGSETGGSPAWCAPIVPRRLLSTFRAPHLRSPPNNNGIVAVVNQAAGAIFDATASTRSCLRNPGKCRLRTNNVIIPTIYCNGLATSISIASGSQIKSTCASASGAKRGVQYRFGAAMHRPTNLQTCICWRRRESARKRR
jgi:hypothetical protein